MTPAVSGAPQPPTLVAHRGYASRYPENTITSLRAALEAGACYVEFDVQLCADRVPVLMHDASLRRTVDVDASVLELPLARLRELEANERGRLGDAFSGVAIPTLAEAIALLADWPRAEAFVEIKEESVAAFGRENVVGAVLDGIERLARRCIAISFDREVIRRSRELGVSRIGWILPDWNEATRRRADELGPEFLFCDRRRLPRHGDPWPGPWRWAVYEVTDTNEAMALAARGVELVETMAIGEMLADSRLARAGCGSPAG